MTLIILLLLAQILLPNLGVVKGDAILYVSDEIVVQLKAESGINTRLNNSDGIIHTGISSLDRLNETYRVTRWEPLFPTEREGESLQRYYIIKFERGTLQEVFNSYLSDSNVENVEKIGIHPVITIPNDPYFSDQWYLNETQDHDIDAPEAWNITTGDTSVIIGIIDTGVLLGHPDLTANIWHNPDELPNGIDDDGNGYPDDTVGWDWVDVGSGWEGEDISTPDADPSDFNGHGTHVAGITSAMSNNLEGIAGISWNTKIMALRVGWSDSLWYGGQIYEVGYVRMDWCASAINYAVNKGADIINTSWVSSNTGGLKAAVDNAITKGVLIVHAAGNDDNSIQDYLSSRSDVLTVAATDIDDKKAYFSNYGSWVDISAPGDNILSTYSIHYTPGYAWMSGTSMSSPVVCGVAALVKSLSPDSNGQFLFDVIVNTADSIDSLNPGYEGKLGSGRVNAYNALKYVNIAEDNIAPPQRLRTSLRIYPNPSSGIVNLQFIALVQETPLIKIYNSAGELVKSLIVNMKNSDRSTVIWDGRDTKGRKVKAGVYFIKLVEDTGKNITKRVVLLR